MQKKAAKQFDAKLAVDRSIEGRVLSGLHMAMKTIVAEERAAKNSKSVSKLRNSLINLQTGSMTRLNFLTMYSLAYRARVKVTLSIHSKNKRKVDESILKNFSFLPW